MKTLVIIDMQNDFIEGSLGTDEGKNIVEKVVKKINDYENDFIISTCDTHGDDYLQTTEGKYLPVEHCVIGTPGWELNAKIKDALMGIPDCRKYIIEKPTFGSLDWGIIDTLYETESIEIVGVCTDICVISNALALKTLFPDTRIIVNSSCCAGTSPDSHQAALKVMKMCQVEVI